MVENEVSPEIRPCYIPVMDDLKEIYEWAYGGLECCDEPEWSLFSGIVCVIEKYWSETILSKENNED